MITKDKMEADPNLERDIQSSPSRHRKDTCPKLYFKLHDEKKASYCSTPLIKFFAKKKL